MSSSPRRKISGDRQALYYGGMALTAVGLMVFIGNMLSMSGGLRDMGSMMTTALIGMGLMVAGQFMSRIGKAGLAGSGVVLDPEQAREDLEPFSRQGGGMLKDALDEAGLSGGLGGGGREQVIMIRCQNCSTLNEEGSKFCQECGEPL